MPGTDPTEPTVGSQSSMWTMAIVVTVLLAVASGVIASVLTFRSIRLVGEGELLVSEAVSVRETLSPVEEADVDVAMRRIRNDLEIESVSIVSADGRVVASTSDSTPIGASIDPILVGALERGVFRAAAVAIRNPISIDGVVEWRPGEILYLAVQPLGDGRGVVLAYDLAEMLARRAEATRISPFATPLAIVSGLLLLVAGLLFASRARARQVRHEMALESGYLRRQAEELQRHNAELEVARWETQQALDLAEEKNRIRAEFVLMINHELRTPLTGVVTGARVLEMSPCLDVDERAILADVLTDGERLETLISQMLAVARVENRGLTSRPVRQPLPDVIERLESAHRSASICMVDDFDPAWLDVSTDATTLSQLVASLVDNAFTHGARHADVVIGSTFPDLTHYELGVRPDPGVYIAVVDDGPGIDREFLPRAFEKFEKQSFSSGTGLGLYMVRMMAESINASLSVISSPEGTVVAVGIPAARALEQTG